MDYIKLLSVRDLEEVRTLVIHVQHVHVHLHRRRLPVLNPLRAVSGRHVQPEGCLLLTVQRLVSSYVYLALERKNNGLNW